ncbi:MAG: hypothetical protein ACKO4Q_06715, partial [Planctomycetota bacterium]
MLLDARRLRELRFEPQLVAARFFEGQPLAQIRHGQEQVALRTVGALEPRCPHFDAQRRALAIFDEQLGHRARRPDGHLGKRLELARVGFERKQLHERGDEPARLRPRESIEPLQQPARRV